MKIGIVGAGAIGGYLAVQLALSGVEVSVVARGANLEAIRRNGLRLIHDDGSEHTVTVAVSDDLAALGPQDAVILAVKTSALPALAPTLHPLYAADTMVVPAQNGVPWWYFLRHGGPHEGRRIESVDPDGLIAEHIPIERIIGCVVYPAAELVAPGVVRHIEGTRFLVGEPDGQKTARVQALSQTLVRAGLKAPVRTQIRADIWLKLWGNLTFNPISALTRAMLDRICADPHTRELARTMMAEGQAIAERLGVSFNISIEQRIAGAEQVGAHKTSMLQDIEQGKPTEIDALTGAVAELGRLVGVPTPAIDAVYACVKLLEQTQHR